MRNFKILLLASATAVAGFQAANAADAIDQIPQAPIVSESFAAPAGDWSGAYIGGAGTYDFGKFTGSNNGRDANGLGASLYGGYNMQNGQLVYGAEADIGYNGEDGSAGAGLTGTQGVNGSVRGRVGYDLNPFMVYGTAGLAVANHELEGLGTNDERIAAGYTVGAGVEAFVTDNITARVEYRYSDYQKRDFNLNGTTISRGFDDHSVKMGVGVKF
ncbi:porin family protein [Peteryoungia desertarenae]|uniref:Porin family protein n=1 Tax=Peteryoungia desertarenae TaxID=1813451 RepID=A0ABX6QNZ2_9HYPH|nr:outer membrane protein [Peteryoungia desertarenae]QLF70021.1 porin family protein [Peteryoungia desertarenae]